MDLKDTIIKQLSAPVKRKGTQDYMTDEEGNIVTSEAAIGMTIVQKALSGDLQAVAFVLNLQMQQQRDPKTEAEDADRRRQQTEANRNEIRRSLEADNLWSDSLALDLDRFRVRFRPELWQAVMDNKVIYERTNAEILLIKYLGA